MGDNFGRCANLGPGTCSPAPYGDSGQGLEKSGRSQKLFFRDLESRRVEILGQRPVSEHSVAILGVARNHPPDFSFFLSPLLPPLPFRMDIESLVCENLILFVVDDDDENLYFDKSTFPSSVFDINTSLL